MAADIIHLDPDAPLWVNVDARIIQAIRDIRAEHHACTMNAVASVCHLAVSAVSRRCNTLKERGLITFNAMQGSLDVPAEVVVNPDAVWVATPLPNLSFPPPPPLHAPVMFDFTVPPWHKEILDTVLTFVVASRIGPVDQREFLAVLDALVPRPPAQTDEAALAIARQLELGTQPAAPPLSSLEEALRLDALGALEDVPDMTDSSGNLISEEAFDRLQAESASLPNTRKSKPIQQEMDRAKKSAAASARKVKTKPPRTAPARRVERTPEQIEADKARMAAIRARRRQETDRQ